MSISRLDQIRNIDPKILLKEGAHVFVCGATGSGKTSTLFWLATEYYQIGETIIWRDSKTLEFLSFLDVIPIKVFVPQGCELKIKHDLVEQIQFDPKQLDNLFYQFEGDRLNVIVFDYFCFDNEVKIRFWANFFYSLWKWKSSSMKRIRDEFCFIIDEFNFLCPGDKRLQVSGQRRLSNNLYESMTSFRKWRIRLLGSSHNPNDVYFPVRQQFSFKIYKRLSRQAVPEDYRRPFDYSGLFPKLTVYQAIVEDEAGFFNRIPRVPEPVKPRKFTLARKGIVGREQVLDEEEERPLKRARKWRARALKLARILYENGVLEDYKDFGECLDLSESYAWKLFAQVKGTEMGREEPR